MQREQESQHLRGRVRQTLRSALLVAGHLSEQAVRRAAKAIRQRFEEDSLLRSGGRIVVDQVSKGADAVIAKSPVPIPQPVQEAMSRMQDGLGQLSHAHQDLSDIAAWELHQKQARAQSAERRDGKHKKKKHHRHDGHHQGHARDQHEGGHEPN